MKSWRSPAPPLVSALSQRFDIEHLGLAWKECFSRFVADLSRGQAPSRQQQFLSEARSYQWLSEHAMAGGDTEQCVSPWGHVDQETAELLVCAAVWMKVGQ
jgi:hypothetical protein